MAPGRRVAAQLLPLLHVGPAVKWGKETHLEGESVTRKEQLINDYASRMFRVPHKAFNFADVICGIVDGHHSPSNVVVPKLLQTNANSQEE